MSKIFSAIFFSSFFLVLVGISTAAQAYVPSVQKESADLMSPALAWTYYQGQGVSSDPAPDRNQHIKELAAALRYDPDAIYEYVYNTIDFVPMFGLKHGAVGAAVNKSGTSFDQAHLLVELLRESGYSPSYKYGTVSLSASEFGKLFGIFSGLNETNQTFSVNAKAACKVLADGGIPATVNGSTNCDTITGNVSTIVMSHVWVSVTIGVSTYELDPSRKAYQLKAGISNLGTTLGFSSVDLMSVANCTSASCSSIDVEGASGLHAKLKADAQALLTYIRNNDVSMRMVDLLGGRDTIIPHDGTPIAQMPALSGYGSTATWSAHIPNSFRTTLRVDFYDINHTFYADEVGSERLWIEFEVVPGSTVGTPGLVYDLNYILRTDSQAIVSSQVKQMTTWPTFENPHLQDVPVTLDVNHPYAANSGGYADALIEKDVDMGRRIAIVFSLGPSSPNLQQLWADYAAVAPENYNLVIEYGWNQASQVYFILAGSWMTASSYVADGAARISDGIVQRHHSAGFIYPENYWTTFDPPSHEVGELQVLNVMMDVDSSISGNTATASATGRSALLDSVASGFSSAEAGVLSEVMGLAKPASTATVLRDALAPSGVVSEVSSGSFSNAAYTSAQVASIGAYTAAGYDVFAPHTANITSLANQEILQYYDARTMKASAFVAVHPTTGDIAHVVMGRGAPKKGAIAEAEVVDLYSLCLNYAAARAGVTGDSLGVDLLGGALNFSAPADISLGTGNAGDSLNFQRHYSSNRGNASNLGRGWVHNYHRVATLATNVGVAVGQNRAIDATAFIAAAYAAQNIPSGSGIEEVLIRTLSHGWWAEELRNNVVNVVEGASTRQFVRAVDGTFEAPLADTATLTMTGTPVEAPTITEGSFTAERNAYDFRPIDFELATTGGTTTYFDVHSSKRGTYDPNTDTYAWIEDWKNPAIQFSRQTFADGNEVTATYRRQEVGITYPSEITTDVHILDTVKNAYGRELTFNYVPTVTLEVMLSTVDDSAGRQAKFHYQAPDETSPTANHSNRLAAADNTKSERTIYVHSTRHWFDSTVPTFPSGSQRTVGYAGPGMSGGPNGVYLVTGLKPSFAERLEQVYVPSVANLATDIYNPGPDDFLTFEYDERGFLTTIRNALDKDTDYHLPGASRADIVSPIGAITTVWYDQRGRAVAAMDPVGNASTAEYDNFNRLKTLSRPEGNGFSYQYDLGAKTKALSYSNVTQVTQHPKPNTPETDIITTFEYADANWPNRVTKAVDGEGNETRAVYASTTGLLTSFTEAYGSPVAVTTTYTYLSLGRVSLTTLDPSSLNEVTQNTYYPVSSTSGALHNNGEPKEVIVDPGGLNLTTTNTYDAVGNVLTTKDARQNTASYTYDLMRRQTQVTQPLGAITKNTYDLDGLMTKVERATGGTPAWQLTQNIYDDVGRLIETLHPDTTLTITTDNPRTKYTYDDAGRKIIVEDAEGRKVKTEYDLAGRVLKTIAGFESPLQQDMETNTWSANGQRLTVADAKGNLSTFEYDGHDRRAKTIFPSKTIIGQSDPADFEAFKYNRNASIVEKQNRAGDTIFTAYDALNRVVEKDPQTTPANLAAGTVDAPTICYAYDKAGRQRFVEENNGTCLTTGPTGALWLEYDYDKAGRMNWVEREDGKRVSYLYDANGNRTRTTYPDSAFYVTYSYDALNRLDTVMQNGSVPLADYDHDLLSRRDLVQLGSGANPAQVDLNYAIDNDLTTLNHSFSGAALNYTFGYNQVGQVTSKTLSDDTYLWTPAVDKADIYTPNGLNQYASVDGTAFTYDKNGNLTFDGLNSYTYDTENRLISVSQGGSPVVDYRYDPTGPRRQKTVNPGGTAVVTQYLLDTQEEIEEYDGSGNLAIRYIHGLGVDERLVFIDYGGGSPTTSFYHTDRSGSTVAMTDANGAVIPGQQYRYSPYGISGTEGDGGNPFRYTGRRLDAETGLYYYRARYYSPLLGRFLQTDPIGYGDGMNMYAYVKNNPTNGTDPTGLRACGLIPLGSKVEGDTFTVTARVVPCPPGVFDFINNISARAQSAILQDPKNRLLGALALEGSRQLSCLFGGPCVLNVEGDEENAKPYEGETPADKPENFEDKGRGKKTRKLENKDDGSIWERDRDGHGGSAWKRWPNERKWDKNKGRQSVRPDGSTVDGPGDNKQ